jgi:phosphopantothenoylcysteine decarboxylase / phosphopantothenate---cysteine ligase
MGLLDGKFVVLGVSGGIAAYRSCELTRLLIKDGAEVQVVLTEAAAELVGPQTFQALSGRPAEVGRGGRLSDSGMAHIDLGARADAIIVAPATANTLAKTAAGLADNLLLTTLLASRCPVILAPAMNTRMWENRLTQANISLLAQIERMRIVGPATGSLACGEDGAGRMEEPLVLLEATRTALVKQDLKGKRILVTAGPTREPLDPVRFLSNRSSGKMGYALAAAAARRGAQVMLISGPSALPPPWNVRLLSVTTAAEMSRAVNREIGRCQALLMAAAVADFTPAKVARRKLKKAAGVPQIELKPTVDILAKLGKKKGPVLVGFAAETQDAAFAASGKLSAKHLDLVVANDVSLPDAGFEVDTNRVQLIDKNGAQELPLLTKEETAARILDRLVDILRKPKKK